MSELVAILSVLVVVGTAALVLNNLRTCRYDALSYRNLFLLGFAHFFGIGSYFTALAPPGALSPTISHGPKGLLTLFVSTALFVVVFAAFSPLGSRWTGLRRVVPRFELPLTGPGVLISIGALLATALVASLIGLGSYSTAVFTQFRGGLATSATALATYYLLARRFNPVAWAVFAGTFGLAILISTVGDIGRRSMLGVLLAVGWMWYYFSLRGRRFGTTVIKLGGLGAAAFIALVLYAGIRGQGQSGTEMFGWGLGTRARQLADLILNPTVQEGTVQSSILSDAPTNSMFIMENYPGQYPHVPFHGVMYFFSNPIPRALWPGKPLGMGSVLQEQTNSQANLGVGILGHGWAEGGYIGVVGYAVFFALFCGAVDNLIRQRAWNPFFLATIGSSLGNVYALARGETSLFMLQITNGFIGVMVVLYLLKLFLGPLMAAAPPLVTAGNSWILDPDPQDEHEHAPGSWDIDPDELRMAEEYTAAGTEAQARATGASGESSAQ